MPISDIDFSYELDRMSVVFDVGGFDGDFTDLIRKKYDSGVHVFEPCKQFFIGIMNRFKTDPMVWPYNVALEDENKDGILNIRNNSSSIYFEGVATEEIKIRDIHQFVTAFKLQKIDLLKLNCEGSEYKIITKLIQTDWIHRVNNITVQFHGVQGWDKDAMEDNLRKTHQLKHKDDYWQWWKK